MQNITKTVYKVGDFLSWQRNSSLALSPSFQRRPVWSPAAKSYLLDTVIQGLPVPIIFLREQTDLKTLEPMREVVDGQQRLRTLLAFVEPESLGKAYDPRIDDFTILKAHNKELSDTKFVFLPNPVKQQILNYEFSVHVLPSDTEDREVLQIFARMNATGVKLNSQELRNAQYFGVLKQLIYQLAYEQLEIWRRWGVFSENNIARMIEVEETSDYIYTMVNGLSSKSQSQLNRFYKDFEEAFPYEKVVTSRFRAVMEKIDDQLGSDLRQTEFSRIAFAHTLFTFYYDLLFGLNSPLVSTNANKVPSNARVAVLAASDMIRSGKISEDLSKLIRGGTQALNNRLARLNFLKERLQHAKKQQ
jgi:uncharacterized protein with ParB-like and HNH nuclease domain